MGYIKQSCEQFDYSLFTNQRTWLVYNLLVKLEGLDKYAWTDLIYVLWNANWTYNVCSNSNTYFIWWGTRECTTTLCISVFTVCLQNSQTQEIIMCIRVNLYMADIFVPRLFEEKRKDTVFGFPWCVVCGAWCVARSAWCVARGAWCMVPNFL